MSVSVTKIVVFDSLPNIIDKLEPAGTELAQYFISEAYDKSQELVPVDTTRLKASGHVEEYSNGFALVYDAGNDWSGDPYARYQEYGTRFHGAQPFLTPAFEVALGRLVKKAPQILEDLLT